MTSSSITDWLFAVLKTMTTPLVLFCFSFFDLFPPDHLSDGLRVHRPVGLIHIINTIDRTHSSAPQTAALPIGDGLHKIMVVFRCDLIQLLLCVKGGVIMASNVALDKGHIGIIVNLVAVLKDLVNILLFQFFKEGIVILFDADLKDIQRL